MPEQIIPGDPNKTWEEVLEVKTDGQWKVANSALMLVTANMVFGGKKADRHLFTKLVWDMLPDKAETILDDDERMLAMNLGTLYMLWCFRKIIEAKPKAWRAQKVFSKVDTEV